jgi:hypothetical protein
VSVQPSTAGSPSSSARLERVCFVAGAAHSGSTLLGLALGAHPRVFYAGEADKSAHLTDPRVKERKRTCKVCGPGCPVWTDLAWGSAVTLYDALAARTERAVIVDSTKRVDWIEARLAELAGRPLRVSLVDLRRDPRAVLASRLRKDPEPGARAHAEAWAAQRAAVEALAARFPGDVHGLDYEALATAPEATLGRLCAALGLPWDPAVLDPWTAPQHPLGGNAGTQSLLASGRTAQGAPLAVTGEKARYYGSHPRAFVLDTRHLHQLGADALAVLEDVLGRQPPEPLAKERT